MEVYKNLEGKETDRKSISKKEQKGSIYSRQLNMVQEVQKDHKDT